MRLGVQLRGALMTGRASSAIQCRTGVAGLLPELLLSGSRLGHTPAIHQRTNDRSVESPNSFSDHSPMHFPRGLPTSPFDGPVSARPTTALPTVFRSPQMRL